MQDAVERSGMFFQMGFMRRFDAGYAAAKRQIDEGRIGDAARLQVDVARSVPPEPRVRRTRRAAAA